MVLEVKRQELAPNLHFVKLGLIGVDEGSHEFEQVLVKARSYSIVYQLVNVEHFLHVDVDFGKSVDVGVACVF